MHKIQQRLTDELEEVVDVLLLTGEGLEARPAVLDARLHHRQRVHHLRGPRQNFFSFILYFLAPHLSLLPIAGALPCEEKFAKPEC